MGSESLPPISQDDQTAFSSHTQVKLQLTTRHADISLPENTGPVLVNTSVYLLPLSSLTTHSTWNLTT